MKKIILFAFLLIFKGLDLSAQEEEKKEEEAQILVYNNLKKALREPKKVTVLNLSGQGLKKLPPDIKKLTNLQTLNLSHNSLTDIPAEIGQLSNLQTLNISYNQLASLPSEIGQLSNLQTLNLHNNQLEDLPAELGSLSNLKLLSLFGNKFLNYPTALNNLKNLQSLDLSGNQLITIPADIRKLSSLQYFAAHYNQLTSLSPEIGRMSNLQLLSLYKNELTTLPKELKNLTRLNKLLLNDNPFKSIPEDLYKFLQNHNYGESDKVKDLVVALTDKKEKEKLLTEKAKEKATLQAQIAEKEKREATLKADIAEAEKEQIELEKRIAGEKDSVKRALLIKEKELREKELSSLKELQVQKELARQKEKEVEQFRLWSSIIVGILIITFVSVFALMMRRNAQKQKKINELLEQKNKIIAEEKAKSEALLLNILPQDVVEELKEKGITTVQYYEHTSVLFADVKGFSALAARVKPQELIKELDACFGKFDEIIAKYGLERIKTIGDCYMCAGGVPHRSTTHTLDICLAALEIQNWMDDEKKRREAEGGTYWQARLGIHTGDLVAGVIGKTKFAYDVWGNTVNTASRMESGGEAGKVNITEATYLEIKDFFVFESRGKIDAKNIGMVETFFVSGIKKELSLEGKGIEPNEKFWELKKEKFGELGLKTAA